MAQCMLNLCILLFYYASVILSLSSQPEIPVWPEVFSAPFEEATKLVSWLSPSVTNGTYYYDSVQQVIASDI